MVPTNEQTSERGVSAPGVGTRRLFCRIRISSALLAAALIVLNTSAAHAAALLLEDNFESGNLSKWTESSDKITTEQVHGGKYALKYQGWPGTQGMLSRSTTDAYVSMWWYIPAGFNWNEEGMGGRHFWRLASSTNHQRAQIDTVPRQGVAKAINFDIFTGSQESLYQSGAVVPEGRWFQLEMHMKLNDKGKANGLFEAWIDKKPIDLRVGYTDQWVKKIEGVIFNWESPFDKLFLTTNYNNNGSPCPGICHWYLDDVQVWEGCPPGSACGTGTQATPTPLPAAVWMMVPALAGLVGFRHRKTQ